MHKVKSISGYQFAVFRIVFGLYLAWHFAGLIPYGGELFSREGVLGDSRLNLTHGILPNPLEHWDSPSFVTAFLVILVALAVSYTLGFFRRTVAVLLWFGWACLFNRNNLISNPGIPYVGMLLLLSALAPAGEPLAASRKKPAEAWEFPAAVYWVAWVLMAVGYTFSGCVKLQSPSWVDGTALTHLVNNPLARPGMVRDLFLALPRWAAQLSTWSSLGLEILFLPLSFHRRTRALIWTGMVAMHIGILLMVDFADLTFGMLMLHLFTFDPNWLLARAKQMSPSFVLFDGVCGLCDRTVQMLLDEDRANALRFAPLQGVTASGVIQRHPELGNGLKSLVLVRELGTPHETIHLRSEGALRILNELGGFWRVVSWLRIIPRPLRDAVYNWIAANRYRWFGKYNECRMPTPETQKRFLP